MELQLWLTTGVDADQDEATYMRKYSGVSAIPEVGTVVTLCSFLSLPVASVEWYADEPVMLVEVGFLLPSTSTDEQHASLLSAGWNEQ